MTLFRPLIAVCLVFSLGGCVVSAMTGAANKERPLSRSIDDSSASTAISARLKRREGGGMRGVRVAVEDGFVLLSGNVATDELRLEAERIAWTAPKVTKVANEIEVTGHRGFFGNAKDRWITTQVRSRLVADNAIRSTNINIETRRRTVFLLGLARTPGEIERITDHARLVPGVRKVVSYITLAQKQGYGRPAGAALEGGPDTGQ